MFGYSLQDFNRVVQSRKVKRRWIHQKLAEDEDRDAEIRETILLLLLKRNTILVVIDSVEEHSRSIKISSSSNFNIIRNVTSTIRPIRIQMQVVTHLITAQTIAVIIIIIKTGEVRAHIKMRISTALFTSGYLKDMLQDINRMMTVALGEHMIHLRINRNKIIIVVEKIFKIITEKIIIVIIVEKIIKIMKMRDILKSKSGQLGFHQRKDTMTTMVSFQIMRQLLLDVHLR
jgi:hypothetical protein